MTTGCKIWLWILLIGSGVSALVGMAAIPLSFGTGIVSVMLAVLAFVGVFLMLFKEKREGFYLLCLMAVIDAACTIVLGGGMLMPLLSVAAKIGITYYFINKGKAGRIS